MKFEPDSIIEKFPDISIQDYLGIVVRGKWIILISLVSVLLIAYLYIKLSDPVYKTSASILINTRFNQPTIFFDAMRRWESDKNFTQNEMEILKSKSLSLEVAQKLVDKQFLNYENTKPILIIQATPNEKNDSAITTIEQIASRVRAAVDFNEVRGTDVIEITATSKDPIEAALIATTTAKTYYDRNIQTSRAKSQAFREFLEVQLGDKRNTLSEAEDSLQRYMDKGGIYSLDEESKKLIDQLASLESQRDQTDIEIQSLTRMLSSYEEQIPEQQKMAEKVMGDAADPYIRMIQEQLAKLEVQRDVTIAQNPAGANTDIYNDQISEIDNQIKSLRGQLQKRTNEFLGTLLPGSQTGTESAAYLKQVIQKSIEGKMQLQSLLAKKNALNEVIATYEKQFAQLPGQSIRFARLQRTKISNEKLYTTIQEKYNEAVMTEQSQFGYIEVIDTATVPNHPSEPKGYVIITMGIILGLVLGIGIVFVKDRVALRVQSPEDLKRKGLNIRGTLMLMKKPFQSTSESTLLAMSEPFSAVAEGYKHLRTNLQYVNNGQALRSILVTSSIPSEGKTTIVANLAIAFSQLGKKVVLIDVDLRKPNLFRYFEGKLEPGLTDFLLGDSVLEKIIQPTKIDNIHLISSGIRSQNTSEIVSSVKMKNLLTELQDRYDLVLLDSSPVLAGTEPTILSTLVDQIILVVSAGETRINELMRAIEELGEPQGKTPGIVLNKFNIYRAYGIPYGHSGYGYYPYASKS